MVAKPEVGDFVSFTLAGKRLKGEIKLFDKKKAVVKVPDMPGPVTVPIIHLFPASR